MSSPNPSDTRPALAICLDDYGLHPGINAAALALAGQGRLQAISGMVGAPAWAEGLPGLATLNPQQVDVGLHLDLTEHPLRGPAWPLPQLIARAYWRQLDAGWLRDEVAAQLDAFVQSVGRPPAHVDGHQHVHQLPQVRQALLQALAARWPAGGRSVRPWLRSTRRPAGLWSAFKPAVIQALGDGALRRLARQAGLVQNRRFLGVYGFDADAAAYQARLARWLAQAGPGDLLMVHASAAPAAGAPADAILPARLAEYEVLRSGVVDELLGPLGLRLAPISGQAAGS